MKVKKLKHVAIIVNNLENMIKFYKDILKFELKKTYTVTSDEIREGIGIKDAKFNGAHLKITNTDICIELLEFENNIKKEEKELSADYPGLRHIAIVVENLDTTYNELKEKNIEFISAPITVQNPACFRGFKFVYMKDPEGNIIELNETPQD